MDRLEYNTKLKYLQQKIGAITDEIQKMKDNRFALWEELYKVIDEYEEQVIKKY